MKGMVQEAYRVMAELLKACNATVKTETTATRYGKELVALFWQMQSTLSKALGALAE